MSFRIEILAKSAIVVWISYNKIISVKLPSCYYKRYITNNNFSNTDTELPDTDPSNSDKEEEKVVEVAANSRNLGKVALS
jgi:hypothetical protein